MRDIKLNQILEDDVVYFKYIVLDIDDVRLDNKLNTINRVKIIKNSIEYQSIDRLILKTWI